MAVKHIFLAILSKKPMHGYDLKNTFEELVSDQWSLNFGQVYTTLSRLERDGLVSVEAVKQEEKPDKKIYSLTEEGKEQLDIWLKQEPDWSVFHDELSFQLTALEYLNQGELISFLSGYRAYLSGLIRELILKKSEIADQKSMTAWVFERNIMKAEADVKWVENYIQSRGKKL